MLEKIRTDSLSFALSHHEIVLLLALLVGACEHQITDFKQFLRNPAHKGLSEFKYSQIRRICSIQEKTFFTLVNEELHDLVKVKYHYNISY